MQHQGIPPYKCTQQLLFNNRTQIVTKNYIFPLYYVSNIHIYSPLLQNISMYIQIDIINHNNKTSCLTPSSVQK
jgi:hypothetical protein